MSLAARSPLPCGLLQASLRTADTREAWKLTLPTFYAGDPGFETTLAAIAAAADALRHHTPALLVLDLRGNGGGAAAPGDAVLAATWGEQMLRALDRRRASASLWRVSGRSLAPAGTAP